MRILALFFACSLLGAQTPAARNIIVITADGLRWQEVFTGIDPLLMNEKATHMPPDNQVAAELRRKLWSESPAERRARLMPFLWKTIAIKGVILGNPAKGSTVEVTNRYRVSYPGYSEILTGRAQDSVIKGNDHIQNPAETVLEFLTTKLKKQSALFGSWDTFRWIGEKTPGTIALNAGYQPAAGSARTEELSKLQFEVLPPWPEVRHDYVTCELAIDYMKQSKPRVLYISLGETDDWAHDRRYDRVLETATYFDHCVETIWKAAQATREYRGSTALILTSDHGRGGTLEDWHGHGARVAGADKIWMALLGAGIPAKGELENHSGIKQRDVAPTMLKLLGIDPNEYKGMEGSAIRLE